MKTAIIKTSFWKEDRIFELTPDVRHFYLCLLTNPERNTTQAFKCSDRLLSAYTGYNNETLNLCRKALIEKGMVQFVDGYYILNDQDYVEPTKGKLTAVLKEKYYNELPQNIKELLLSHSGATHEYKDIDNNKDIDKDKKPKNEEAESISALIESFKKINPSYKKWFGNTTQRKACKNLIETHGLVEVNNVIILLSQTNGRQYFPTITTPVQLEDKWAQLVSALKRYKGEKQALQESVAF